MWRVLQKRWIRGSSQNIEPANIVWEGGRKKEAIGQAKANLDSHMEMYEKHEFFKFNDIIHVRGGLLNLCGWIDDYGLVYMITYEVIEYDA